VNEVDQLMLMVMMAHFFEIVVVVVERSILAMMISYFHSIYLHQKMLQL
jgi:hypothetical protein